MIAVDIKGLNKKVHESLTLKDINLELDSGFIYGIVGDNFSGRTELLKVISGLIKGYEGDIKVLGSTLSDIKNVEDIGMSFGINGFIEEYTGFKNLKILASIKENIDDQDIENTLCILGLLSVYKNKVKEYDFEMRKRLSIAQAIMERPSLIIIDEPFMYFKEESIENIIFMLKEINRSRKSTIILGARSEKYLKDICKDLYEIHEGEIKYTKSNNTKA